MDLYVEITDDTYDGNSGKLEYQVKGQERDTGEEINTNQKQTLSIVWLRTVLYVQDHKTDEDIPALPSIEFNPMAWTASLQL